LVAGARSQRYLHLDYAILSARSSRKKISEMTPSTSALLASMLAETFDEEQGLRSANPLDDEI
jgi:hypothetical protein